MPGLSGANRKPSQTVPVGYDLRAASVVRLPSEKNWATLRSRGGGALLTCLHRRAESTRHSRLHRPSCPADGVRFFLLSNCVLIALSRS